MKQQEGDLHAGHRKRVKERVKTNGFEGMAEHEILEWLLFYAIPRGDVNPLAHRLINTFGGLYGVLNAGYESLMAVEGVGDATAQLLSRYTGVYRRYLQSRPTEQGDLAELAVRLQERFIDSREEVLVALLLSKNKRLIREMELSRGTLETVPMNLRGLTEACLTACAGYVVLAHNHPSNILLPSASDVSATQCVAEVLSRLEVRLLDHYIVGEDGCYSMAAAKETAYIFQTGRRRREP